MPELPEVETVRRGLEQRTAGFEIARVTVNRPSTVASPKAIDEFCASLEGCTVDAWNRRGKYLIGKLSSEGQPGGHWGVHLRMTGQFLWLEEAQKPCNHTRVQIWNDGGQELRFIDTRSFGQMWYVPVDRPLDAVITGLARLGPEPFDTHFSVAYMRRQLRNSRRPIKNALLDQSLVAGVGNIYADETLFAAGISPHRTSGSLDETQLDMLRRSLITVLEASIGAGGTTFSDFRDLTGTNGNYGGLALVYRRGGQDCRRCGAVIQRDKLAGRSTHWCPSCQG